MPELSTSNQWSILTSLDVGDEIDWEPTALAPSGWLTHVPFAFWLTKKLRPKTVVELGTHYGVSYFAFCQAIARLGLRARCYAVDSWLGDGQAGAYGEEVYARVLDTNQHFADFSTLLRTTFDNASTNFPDGSIDLLHIDGFHSYEAAKSDFDTWRSKVSDGGVILFHDVEVRRDDFGVWRLWDEITAEHKTYTFRHGHGLGVMQIGSSTDVAIDRLLSLAPGSGEDAFIQAIFARKGNHIRCLQDLQDARSSLVELRSQLNSITDWQRTATQRLSETEASEARAKELEDQISRIMTSNSWRLGHSFVRLFRGLPK